MSPDADGAGLVHGWWGLYVLLKSIPAGASRVHGQSNLVPLPILGSWYTDWGLLEHGGANVVAAGYVTWSDPFTHGVGDGMSDGDLVVQARHVVLGVVQH